MATVVSKSRRRPLRFWGWGYADEHLSAEEELLMKGMVSAMAGGQPKEVTPPDQA